MSKMIETIDGLKNIRDMALRLTLGDSQARALRAIVVELCGVLLGTNEQHPDVDLAGARYPAPTLASVAAAPGQAIASGVRLVPAPPAARLAGPRPTTLAEAAALIEARKASAAPPAPPVPESAPTESAADDPAGAAFLDRLSVLAGEGSEDEETTHSDANGA